MAHILAITEKGEIYSWGKTGRGQCGHVTADLDFPTPKTIDAFFGSRIIDAAAGSNHSAVVLDDGRAFVFGKYQSMIPRYSLFKLKFEAPADQIIPRHVQVSINEIFLPTALFRYI